MKAIFAITLGYRNPALNNSALNYICRKRTKDVLTSHYVYVVVKFLFQVIFVFLLFFGMVMYANEVETKEK